MLQRKLVSKQSDLSQNVVSTSKYITPLNAILCEARLSFGFTFQFSLHRLTLTVFITQLLIVYKKTISSKSTARYSKCYCSPIHTQCASRKFVAVTLQECTTRLIKNYLHYANRKSTLNAWARLQAIMGWLHAFSVTAPTKARRFVYYALRLAGRWFGRIDELLKRHLCDSMLFLPDNSDTTLHITEQFTPPQQIEFAATFSGCAFTILAAMGCTWFK